MTCTYHNCEQGSDEWYRLRKGKVTCSKFGDIMTKPRSGKGPSKTAESYMLDILAEIITGEQQDTFTTKAMQWGTDNEGFARQTYEYYIDGEVETTGFATLNEEPMIGGSPDGLVGEDGGVEIKCPFNTRIHLGYKLAGVLPTEYFWQVHGLLWITGRQWWDFVSFDPRVDLEKYGPCALFVHRVNRDEKIIGQLREAVFSFRDALMDTLCKLKGE